MESYIDAISIELHGLLSARHVRGHLGDNETCTNSSSKHT